MGIGIKNQNILDIGTGTGVFPRAMYKYGAKYTGIDISEEQINYAKELSVKQNMDNKVPKWANNNFEVEQIINYTENLVFNHETWTGRIRARRGVSAALPENIIKEFDEEHIKTLKEITKEPFEIIHEIKISIFKMRSTASP
jgi:ribosomal protein L11 methylase PrmA